MYEVSQPLLGGSFSLGIQPPIFRNLLLGGHVERPLSKEGLGVGWHVREVVADDEHLDDGAQGIEEGDLDGSLGRNAVALLAEVDVAWKKNIHFKSRKYSISKSMIIENQMLKKICGK